MVDREVTYRNDDGETAWHLDKKVPIALLLGIIGQTFVFGWYFSGLSSRVENVERAIPTTTASLERLNEAREDLRLNLQAQTLALNNLSHLLDERTTDFRSIHDALGRIEGNQPGQYSKPSGH